MKTRTLLLSAAASLALAASANAATVNGWYVSLEGGANWIEDWDHTYNFTTGVTVPGSASFDTGWAVLASVGYGFGGGWRAEFEAGYRDNEGDGATFTGVAFPASVLNYDLSEVSLMLNVLYDIPLTERLSLSLGAGAGADYAMVDHNFFGTALEDENWSFAYQGIAGLNYAIGRQTDLFLNYRYFRVSDPEFDFTPAFPLIVTGDDIVKHTATIGLRYHFGAAPPPPEPYVAPPPPPPPPPAAPQQFIVFFGFNKCNITAEADNVLSEAASTAKSQGSASIQIVGHTDTSGSNKYNQKLSECRAGAAKTNLVGKGIAEGAISATGRGETELMVQTGDGVKEPQNRRAHINLQ